MTLQSDFLFRGLVHQVSDESVWAGLNAGSLTAYAGFDPTADSLHLGHLLQILNLRRLQIHGNRPIVLAGGGTGLIGDPSFKSTERPLLTAEQIQANLVGVREQLERFLDFSPGSAQARLLDNAAWLTTVPVTDFLRDVGKHFTVNQMIARDSVRTRLETPEMSLSFTEFSYILLQSYDFLRLHVDEGCSVQLGGSDQWVNILGGVDLIRRTTGATAYALTSPLLLRSDGQKYGKSEGGNDRIWLDARKTSPFALHQFLLQTEDAMVSQLLRFFTFLEHDEIRIIDEAMHEAPEERRGQRVLAHEVVGIVHGHDAALKAERAGAALFAESIAELDEATLLDVLADAPHATLARTAAASGVDGVDLLLAAGLATSKGEARRFLEQGGVYLNNRRLTATATTADALHGRYFVVRRGKRQTCLVELV